MQKIIDKAKENKKPLIIAIIGVLWGLIIGICGTSYYYQGQYTKKSLSDIDRLITIEQHSQIKDRKMEEIISELQKNDEILDKLKKMKEDMERILEKQNNYLKEGGIAAESSEEKTVNKTDESVNMPGSPVILKDGESPKESEDSNENM
jgi:hypothetical protein